MGSAPKSSQLSVRLHHEAREASDDFGRGFEPARERVAAQARQYDGVHAHARERGKGVTFEQADFFADTELRERSLGAAQRSGAQIDGNRALGEAAQYGMGGNQRVIRAHVREHATGLEQLEQGLEASTQSMGGARSHGERVAQAERKWD